MHIYMPIRTNVSALVCANESMLKCYLQYITAIIVNLFCCKIAIYKRKQS